MTTDQEGLDTGLARLLHRDGRVALATLQHLLQEARTHRPDNSLALMLVERGLLEESEARGYLHSLRSDLNSSLDSGAFVPAAPSGPQGTQLTSPPWEQSGPGPTGTEVLRAGSGPTGTEVGPAPWNQSSLGPTGTEVGGGRPQAPRRDPWKPGSQIGDYLLLERVGAGNMGVVYRAEHQVTKGRYALKTLGLRADEELEARLRRESQAQAQVDGHPNVVRIHSMGEHEGRPYLIMELAAGGDLQHRMRLGALPIEEAARIVRALARGLAHMHANQVLHRDIKPSNVLFDEEENPKLVDFGLAHFAGARSLTRTGDVVGTPVYMAPEQAVGRRDLIGPPVDVYALGGILYHALTGRIPFPAATTVEVFERLMKEEPEPLRSLRPEIPEALEAICLRALAKRPDARPTAQELADQLDEFLVGDQEESRERGSPVLWLIPVVLLIVGVIAIVLLSKDPEDHTPVDPAAAELAQEEEQPQVTPEQAPQPKERPPTWRWGPDDDLRCGLTMDWEAQWTRRGKTIAEAFQHLVMSWKAEQVEAEKATVTCTIDQVVIRWELRGGFMGQFPPMRFDSQKSQDKSHRFHRIVGKTFTFEMNRYTGEVHKVSGASAIQRQVSEGLERMELWRHNVPILDEAILRQTLNAFLHLLPPRSAKLDKTWRVPRPAPLLISQRGRGRRTQIHSLEPSFKQVEETVHWKDSSRKKREPYEMVERSWGGATRWRVEKEWSERTLTGQARLDERGVVFAKIVDGWKGDQLLRNDQSESKRPFSGTWTLTFQVLKD